MQWIRQDLFNVLTDTLVDGVVVAKKQQGLIGFEVFLTASKILKRKLRGRINTIVITETQTPAELAKLTEVEVLSGIVPSIRTPSTAKVQVKKTWVTVADNKVRSTHLEADGQRQLTGVPFIVGGDPMMGSWRYYVGSIGWRNNQLQMCCGF